MMFTKGKYVVGVLLHQPNQENVAICFPENIQHTSVGNLFESIKSAGFFILDTEPTAQLGIDISVFGKSMSLGVFASVHDDTKLVRQALGLDPMY